ncbi:Cys-rich peptide radical SAM maturase CcpM [Peptacetobacter hominis]|uniref:Cys-rich peptide radical SAM maturase CcpM n=1 Tax=Peptacetobacter hominis TaxID=2743610 RepID=A0A544QTM5_9FIRM|nr:Cys-rich peptide radical SAM maturase CcpM [Peptacetobacter hominis]TQQ84042.1 Cys-rich peptide radical SAM maturase CcpM [Peptacetobacter hominis]
MKDNPFIHLFETSDGKYLFDVNKNTIISIPDNVYNFLKKPTTNMDSNVEKYLHTLKNCGFLKSNRVEISEHSETKYLKYYLDNKLSTLLLQLTQNCNLRCDYCIYSGNYNTRTHSNKIMDFELAKDGIDFLIKHSRDSDNIFIGFYGGEPFLNFDLMKKCMDYSLKKIPNKEIYFNVTTNATLLTKEIVDIIVNYNLTILISLDGPKQIHDEARKFAFNNRGSFDTLYNNLKYIKTKYPDYYKEHILFNTVLHQSNFGCVDNYIKSDDLLSDSYFMSTFISDSYSDKKHEISDSSISEIQYEKFLLFLSKIGILNNYKPSKLLDLDFQQIGSIVNSSKIDHLPKKSHHSGVCIPGVQKLFMNVNGDFFPCERVNELSDFSKIGSIKNGLDYNKIEYMMNIENITKEECHNCWAYNHCTICLSGLEDNNGIKRENILLRCPYVKNSIEEKLKDYTVLKSLGYNF